MIARIVRKHDKWREKAYFLKISNLKSPQHNKTSPLKLNISKLSNSIY